MILGVKGLKCAIQYHSKVVNNLDSKLNYQSLKLLRIKDQRLRHSDNFLRILM